MVETRAAKRRRTNATATAQPSAAPPANRRRTSAAATTQASASTPAVRPPSRIEQWISQHPNPRHEPYLHGLPDRPLQQLMQHLGRWDSKEKRRTCKAWRDAFDRQLDPGDEHLTIRVSNWHHGKMEHICTKPAWRDKIKTITVHTYILKEPSHPLILDVERYIARKVEGWTEVQLAPLIYGLRRSLTDHCSEVGEQLRLLAHRDFFKSFMRLICLCRNLERVNINANDTDQAIGKRSLRQTFLTTYIDAYTQDFRTPDTYLSELFAGHLLRSLRARFKKRQRGLTVLAINGIPREKQAYGRTYLENQMSYRLPHMKNLVELRLTFSMSIDEHWDILDVGTMFKDVHLPKLARLHMDEVFISSDAKTTTFFQAHRTTLQELWLGTWFFRNPAHPFTGHRAIFDMLKQTTDLQHFSFDFIYIAESNTPDSWNSVQLDFDQMIRLTRNNGVRSQVVRKHAWEYWLCGHATPPQQARSALNQIPFQQLTLADISDAEDRAGVRPTNPPTNP